MHHLAVVAVVPGGGSSTVFEVQLSETLSECQHAFMGPSESGLGPLQSVLSLSFPAFFPALGAVSMDSHWLYRGSGDGVLLVGSRRMLWSFDPLVASTAISRCWKADATCPMGLDL